MAQYLGATVEVQLRNPPHKIRGQIIQAASGRLALEKGKQISLAAIFVPLLTWKSFLSAFGAFAPKLPRQWARSPRYQDPIYTKLTCNIERV